MNEEINCKYYLDVLKSYFKHTEAVKKKNYIFTFLFYFTIDKAPNIDSDILSKAWNGDAASQLLLGKAYFNTVYVKDNCSDAFKWFQLSAEQENMEAQFRLANLFALGQGAPKSYTETHKWYMKAALQG
jgi:TPR repeat protein